MQVICINNDNRPARIPESKWIKKGHVYTVTDAITMSIQRGKIGYKLAEIELDESCFPYEYFSADRFLPLEKAEAPAKEEVLDLEHV